MMGIVTAGDRRSRRGSAKNVLGTLAAVLLFVAWSFGGTVLRAMYVEKKTFDEAVGSGIITSVVLAVIFATVGLASLIPERVPPETPRRIQKNERAERINAELSELRAELERTRRGRITDPPGARTKT